MPPPSIGHRLRASQHSATTLFLMLALGTPAQGQTRSPGHVLIAEVFGGTAWSLPLPLVVTLPEGAARHRPRWSTRPLSGAPYYSYRVGWAPNGQHAVEAELHHHKLYLENPAPPFERLEITHGYNLPTLNASSARMGWQLRIGVGLVVAHAEGRIAGRGFRGVRTALGGGYQIAGVTGLIALGRRYPLNHGRVVLLGVPEGRLTAAWARVRMTEGSLNIPNVALHALAGFGVMTR
jgi:hypothetical protein